ncbi:MAG TPA: 3-isopropylmalate dehydratase small subunit [Clostridiales bacterium UBA8153]|nr:3-isopropylmalate dehydratase small subunit [Clostridiales bacterium UBA8153]
MSIHGTHRGRVWKYGSNVDTDAIVPARYLTTHEAATLRRHCLEDLDPAFRENVQPGDMLVAVDNFGCGSSREHAPLALKAAGIYCVVAASFARIFFRNAINIGLPVLECPQLAQVAATGDELEVNLAGGWLHHRGLSYNVTPYPEFMQAIIAAGGLVPYVRQRMAGGGNSCAGS